MYSRNEFNLADSSKFLNAENVLHNQFSEQLQERKVVHLKVINAAPAKRVQFKQLQVQNVQTSLQFNIFLIRHQAHAIKNRAFSPLNWT
jgi:homoserine trans-succinylase